MATINVNRYARVFEILCMLLIPAVLLISPLIWFFGDNLTNATWGLQLAHFTFAQRAGLALVETIANLFIVYGLTLLIHIARLFQQDQIFTKLTVSLFMRLRKIACWWTSYMIIYLTLFYSVVTTTFPLSILIASLSTVFAQWLFIFVWISIFVALIIKATELQGDQDLTV